MLFLVVPCLNCCPFCTYCIVILLFFLPLTFSNIITAKKSSIKKWGFSRKQTIVCLTKDLVIYLLCTSYLWFIYIYCSSLISLLLKYIHSFNLPSLKNMRMVRMDQTKWQLKKMVFLDSGLGSYSIARTWNR